MRRYVAEALGTFVLVFGGVGSAVVAGGEIGYLGVALAFGLSLLVMVYAIGPISGCHINPAVTLGAWLDRRLDSRTALLYVVSQILGAVIAAAALFVIMTGQTGWDIVDGFGSNGYGTHSPGGFDLMAVAVAEIVLTAFLVFTVLACTRKDHPMAGAAIGLVLALVHLVGIPIDNTSVNPARSIAPAVFQGGWALEQLWAFLLFPLIGAVAAWLLYTAIFDRLPETA